MAWKIYVMAIPVQRWALHALGLRIYLPEIVSIPLLFGGIRKFAEWATSRRWHVLDAAVVLWPVANILPCLHSGFSSRHVEGIIGSAYLASLYFSFCILTDHDLLVQFHKVYILSAVVAGLLGMLGWSLSMAFGIDSPLAMSRTIPFPYLGHIARSTALTTSANMLASILMIAMLFCVAMIFVREGWSRWYLLVFLTLMISFVSTLSKTMVCFLAGVAVTYYYSRPDDLRGGLKGRLCLSAFVLSCAAIYILGAHFIIAREDKKTITTLAESSYTGRAPLWKVTIANTTYGIYPTNYYFNKYGSLEAFEHSRGWGLGPGGYNGFVTALKRRGFYPKTFPAWDPHSTYFGALAELGWFGLMSVLLIWSAMGFIIFSNVIGNQQYRVLSVALAGAYVAIVMEAIATDVMNFRHYWLLIALATKLMVRHEGTTEMASMGK